MVRVGKPFQLTGHPTKELSTPRSRTDKGGVDRPRDPVVLAAEMAVGLPMPLVQLDFEANGLSIHPSTPILQTASRN